jgi:hypothetical protein
MVSSRKQAHVLLIDLLPRSAILISFLFFIIAIVISLSILFFGKFLFLFVLLRNVSHCPILMQRYAHV